MPALLYRYRLAGDQHSRVTARDPCRQLKQLRTGRFNGDRTVRFARVNAAQGMARHQIEQRFGLERLDQIIRRALAHRIDRTLDCAVGGHQ